jgi:hypothetical protein
MLPAMKTTIITHTTGLGPAMLFVAAIVDLCKIGSNICKVMGSLCHDVEGVGNVKEGQYEGGRGCAFPYLENTNFAYCVKVECYALYNSRNTEVSYGVFLFNLVRVVVGMGGGKETKGISHLDTLLRHSRKGVSRVSLSPIQTC